MLAAFCLIVLKRECVRSKIIGHSNDESIVDSKVYKKNVKSKIKEKSSKEQICVTIKSKDKKGNCYSPKTSKALEPSVSLVSQPSV